MHRLIRAFCLAPFLVAARSGWAQQGLPPGFAKLSAVAPSIRQDIRYATAFNFTGQPVPGYARGECLLREEAARALARAQARLLLEGLGLKAYDCYRPLRAVRFFVDWAMRRDADAMKPIFYPNLEKSRLFDLGYIALHSKHTQGTTIDVGLIRAGGPDIAHPVSAGRCDGPLEQRAKELSLDLGTAYDCFSPRSATAAPAISAAARTNRETLRRALESEGFRNYSREWWHYDLIDPAMPAQVYDFPVR